MSTRKNPPRGTLFENALKSSSAPKGSSSKDLNPTQKKASRSSPAKAKGSDALESLKATIGKKRNFAIGESICQPGNSDLVFIGPTDIEKFDEPVTLKNFNPKHLYHMVPRGQAVICRHGVPLYFCPHDVCNGDGVCRHKDDKWYCPICKPKFSDDDEDDLKDDDGAGSRHSDATMDVYHPESSAASTSEDEEINTHVKKKARRKGLGTLSSDKQKKKSAKSKPLPVMAFNLLRHLRYSRSPRSELILPKWCRTHVQFHL